MLKGIAPQPGGDDLPDDRRAIVVALSQLTETLTSAESDKGLTAAAETVGALLRVSRVSVFTRSGAEQLRLSASVGESDDARIALSARAVAEETLATNGPLVIANTSAHDTQHCAALAKAGVASVVAVPMRVGEAHVGAIVGLSEELRAFSPGDIELLHVVSSHAALAAFRASLPLEPDQTRQEKNEDLVKLAERKIQELSLLNQISEAMSSTLNLDELLDIALEQSLAAVDADAGSLMLIGEESGKLEIAASRGLAPRTVERTSQEIGKSISGWVAEHGESVLVTDAHRDARFDMPFFRDTITSSASVPLKTKGAVIGVLNVNTKRANRLFDERDLELLATVANQMAVAIENARLYSRIERRTQQLSSLLQVSRTITSTLNLDEVLKRLCDETCKLFGLSVCTVFFVDELSGRLRFGYGTGLKTRQKYRYHDLAAPLATRVNASGRRLILRDINSSAALSSEVSRAEGLGAAVALPLRNQGKTVAIAVGFAASPSIYAKSLIAMMGPLGDLGGVAIHNARVYRQKYRIASMLQERLVPSSIPQIHGLGIGHKFLPAREVGGDYYDFIGLNSKSLGVVVSDVSGSDVEAAEYTTMGKHVLRAYAREFASPAEVLTRTNDLICESTSAEVFISTFYGVVDLDRMELRYANAGCEPAILYRAKDKSVSSLRAEGMLLGIRSGVSYEEQVVPIASGDVLAVFTDGLTEAEMLRARFGSDAVKQVVSASAGRSAQKVVDHLHDALLDFTRGRISDDVAIVALKVQ